MHFAYLSKLSLVHILFCRSLVLLASIQASLQDEVETTKNKHTVIINKAFKSSAEENTRSIEINLPTDTASMTPLLIEVELCVLGKNFSPRVLMSITSVLANLWILQ